MVDWSEAPFWAENWQGVWLGDGLRMADAPQYIPRPAPVYRDKTDIQLAQEIFTFACSATGEKLKAVAAAAGIETRVKIG